MDICGSENGNFYFQNQLINLDLEFGIDLAPGINLNMMRKNNLGPLNKRSPSSNNRQFEFLYIFKSKVSKEEK